MTQEKAIRLHNKPLIPMDLVDSASEMDSYLTQLREDSIKHERIRLRVARTQRTRINKSLEVAARKIQVEPSTDSESTQQTKTWQCKKVETEKRKIVACNSNTLEDSGIIVERRVGYKVTCPRCNWSWVWHGKRDRFYISCSRCHKSFKLSWK